MSDDNGEQRRRVIRTNRLEAFSDGVFAIAITLLVLELTVPLGSEEDLLAAIIAQWPSYLAYVVSFATIGVAWLAHSVMTEQLDHVDATFVRLNLLMLLVVSFIPFPTRLVAEYIATENAERVAVTVYGLTLLFASVLIAVLWRYAVHAKLVTRVLSEDEAAALTGRLLPGLAGYLAFIALGLFVPLVAVFGYLLLALFFLIPVHQRERKTRS